MIGPTANDCLDGVLALIHTFIKTLQNKFPSIQNYKYDLSTQRFLDTNGRPVGRERFFSAAKSDLGGAARAGEATLRRGILIQSLMEAEGSERPGLLENVLRGAGHLVTKCAR